MDISGNGSNGAGVSPAGLDGVGDFQTLKESLSRVPNGSHSNLSHQVEETLTHTQEPHRSTKSNKSSPPLFVDIPKLASPADTAFTALQYLPTPILVLSSSKCIILANEAIGRLLGLKQSGALQTVHEDGAIQDLSVTEVLWGQTLAQIGVDMLQDGEPIWVDWEKCLDRLADEMDKGAIEDNTEGEDLAASRSGATLPMKPAHSQATAEPQSSKIETDQPKKVKKPAVVHDAIVEVVLSSQPIHSGRVSSEANKKSLSLSNQVQANMVISIWTLDKQRYFTLSFTSQSSPTSPSTSKKHSRPVSRTPTRVSLSPGFDTSPSSSNGSGARSNYSSCSPSATITNPTDLPLSIAPFPLPGAPSRSNVASAPSLLQKVTKLKDGMLNAMEIPVFAMWKDRSLAFPNKAAARLNGKHADGPSESAYEFFPPFKVYTEDFERELEPDEYPLVVLCRTQKPFTNWKIGMKSPRTERHISYEVSGEGIHDEQTGEFLGGMIALKDVTEYTDKLAAQTEETEQQFQLICDTMPQMLWTTTPQGMHDWFSRRWYDFTGLTAEQSMGTGWQLPFHPDDVPISKERWAHSLATGDEYSTEYRCRRHDGEWRWMLGRALPLKDKTGTILKWFGTCTDIHDLVEARQAAKQTREKLLNVIEHAKVTVWAVDRERNLTFLEGKLMWDVNEEDVVPEAIGHNVYETFGRHAGQLDLPLYKKPIEKIFNGEAKEQISEHHIDGNGRWFRTRFVPIFSKKELGAEESEDSVESVIGVSMDVTEVKKTEASLQSQEEENTRLLSKEAAAKEASRLKSQFLANMSHEIRTPIAGVIGMSELLADTELDTEQRECAENIQRSANGLLTVINDILDLSKVESGRLDIEEVQFSLSVVIRDVSKMLSFAAERKDLDFKSDIQIGMDHDLIVMGDPGRVRQILTNLLTNSIKFTSEGYVKLAVMAQKETAETIEVKFVVEDTGIGIEEEVRTRLFKPFSQADSSTARRFGGTGLGLTICKNLVDLMHGEITLESTLGSGTMATFSIPFNKPQFRNGSSPLIDIGSIPDRLQSEMSVSGRASDQDQTSGTPPPTPQDTMAVASPQRQDLSWAMGLPPGGSLDPDMNLPISERKKIHVLVVEDNAINQQIALKTIKKLNFSVSAVWNGQEALDYLLETPSPSHPKPDIILMDVQMPILDGYQATHLIRHHEPFSTRPMLQAIPIVAMTASAIQGDREKCQKAGMDDYLAKPVKGKVLERMLIKWASESKRKNRLNRPTRPTPTDHDSNCVEPAAVRSSASEAIHSSENSGNAKHNAATDALPGTESEGDRGMRRVHAEEKAVSLRDDKLIAASEKGSHSPPASMEGGSIRSDQPTTALTEENVGRLAHEQEEGHLYTMGHRASPSNQSLTVGGGDSSPASTRGNFRSSPRSSWNFVLNRNDSDCSQRTVTPKTSR